MEIRNLSSKNIVLLNGTFLKPYEKKEVQRGNGKLIVATNAAFKPYEYYDNGYLHKVIDSDGRTTIYEYDAVGNLIKTTRPNGTVEERVYNDAYQLVEQIEKNDNFVLGLEP